MSNPRRKVEFEVQLPKGYIIKSLKTDCIPLDENFRVIVKEGHQHIDEMKLKDARRKYG